MVCFCFFVFVLFNTTVDMNGIKLDAIDELTIEKEKEKEKEIERDDDEEEEDDDDVTPRKGRYSTSSSSSNNNNKYGNRGSSGSRSQRNVERMVE